MIDKTIVTKKLLVTTVNTYPWVNFAAKEPNGSWWGYHSKPMINGNNNGWQSTGTDNADGYYPVPLDVAMAIGMAWFDSNNELTLVEVPAIPNATPETRTIEDTPPEVGAVPTQPEENYLP